MRVQLSYDDWGYICNVKIRGNNTDLLRVLAPDDCLRTEDNSQNSSAQDGHGTDADGTGIARRSDRALSGSLSGGRTTLGS